LALPGVVAFAIPGVWVLTGNAPVAHPSGFGLLIVGTAALLWCVRDFYVQGRGTLAPWSPPTHLVIVGLYRHTRNPMYIAVTLILLGWSVSFGMSGLYFYSLTVVVAFQLRVILGEEPWLAQRHGRQWDEYARRVPRWFW
ncbi:MAG TPA: isoprenylcysteine carboxylmethyltransferase family protein, partial [Dyella sp.]|uniref:methyltransferase family protein n=1 Tax=Dyella sp. TaxID=1869338 RepID=UPI002F93C58D